MKRRARAAVPGLRQETQFTCCATSIAACLQAHGKDQTEADVNKVLGASPMAGATWEAILATLQYFGLRGTLVVPATVTMLKEWTDAGTPVIIAWNPEGRPWSHASVVFDVTEGPTGRLVHVMDSNIPNPDRTTRILPEDEFCAKWGEKVSDSLIVRRPACAVEREVTAEGRQVRASLDVEAFWGKKNPFDGAIKHLLYLAKSPGRMFANDPHHPERPGDDRRAVVAMAALAAALGVQDLPAASKALEAVPPSYVWNVPPEVFKALGEKLPYVILENERMAKRVARRFLASRP